MSIFFPLFHPVLSIRRYDRQQQVRRVCVAVVNIVHGRLAAAEVIGNILDIGIPGGARG